MTKVVDKNNDIIKPVLYGRSEKELDVGDFSEFRSNGWICEGWVQSIRYWEDDRFKSSDGFYVYEIQKYTNITWVGLERTEEEEIEYQKQLEKERQLRFRF